MKKQLITLSLLMVGTIISGAHAQGTLTQDILTQSTLTQGILSQEPSESNTLNTLVQSGTFAAPSGVTPLAAPIGSASHNFADSPSKEQLAQTKEQLAQSKAELVSTLIESGRYSFRAQRAMTNLKSQPFVDLTTSNYSLEIKGDTLVSYLPFYGRAYSAPYGSSISPLDYTSKEFTYKVATRERKKGNTTIVTIQARPDNRMSDLVQHTLEITSGGNATLTINSNQLSSISFHGEIAPLESQK